MAEGDGRSDRADMAAVEAVIAAGEAQGIGSFRFRFADQSWEWSDEVARLHGYEPGEVTPTTKLLLSHKHPDDRERVEEVLVTSLHDHAPFSSQHRIIDTAGKEHQVLVVSDAVADESGEVFATEGYYVDLTDKLADQRNEVLDELLPELLEHRAVIEQAKGALMVVYGLTADQAFRVLKWRSQETNTKLRALAVQLMEELPMLPPVGARTRTAADHILLTIHLRIPAA